MKYIITEEQVDKFLGIPVKPIVSYIKSFYNPKDIEVKIENKNVKIIVLFDEIDDMYLTNLDAGNLDENKRVNLLNKIRRDILNIFSVETSGLTISKDFPIVTAPWQEKNLTIRVYYTN